MIPGLGVKDLLVVPTGTGMVGLAGRFSTASSLADSRTTTEHSVLVHMHAYLITGMTGGVTVVATSSVRK